MLAVASVFAGVGIGCGWLRLDYLLGVRHPSDALRDLLYLHLYDLVLQVLALFVYL